VTAVHLVLDRLECVRQLGPSKWRSRCPGHGSRSLSLAVADIEGRVLLKCFAGCETEAVLASIGLTFSDLYETSIGEHEPLRRSPWAARDVLDLVMVEAHVVGVIASDLLQKRTISEADWRRLSQAAGRLVGIANVVSQ
jgi:hypothetical protein